MTPHAFVVLLTLLACSSALGQIADFGWYGSETGQELLMTPAAEGDRMLYHFGKPPFAIRLFIAGGEKQNARITRQDDAAPVLQWRSESGEWNRARKVAGHYEVVEASFANGDVALSGTLLLPTTPGPHPGAVFIHGSGTSTRDNFWYVWIAHTLARGGIAVLLPDKRGSGRSGGDWETASFHDFAADAAAAVGALRSRERVDANRIGVIGVSQGGHIAPMVPRLVPNLAYAVNLSGSAVPIEEQLRLELTNTLRQSWPDFLVPLIRPFAIRVVKRRRPIWWAKNGKLDPIDYWRTLDVPALVVYGAEDERDNVPVTKSVARLRAADAEDRKKRIEIVVYPDSGHALYTPGTRRIREDFLEMLVAWIRATITRTG